jgi:SAM-dependent methyltransferase
MTLAPSPLFTRHSSLAPRHSPLFTRISIPCQRVILSIMSESDRNQGTAAHIYAQWPGYLLRYGGLILAVLMIGGGLALGWRVLTALGIVLLTAVFFLMIAALWTANRLFDADSQQVSDLLFTMSQAQATDHFANIDLGLRQQAILLSSHLTTGKITVIDVYNPQLTMDSALARARRQAPATKQDPRLTWYDGQFNLFPLPDSSVEAVFMFQVLSEFGQQGDRQALLREVRRILKPNGRLLIAEQTASWLNWLLVGSSTAKLQPVEFWLDLLGEAGFDILRQEEIQGLLNCLRADKPSPYAGKQLPLQLNYPDRY